LLIFASCHYLENGKSMDNIRTNAYGKLKKEGADIVREHMLR